ncbi:MAG: hypothetical protein WCG42_03160 [Parachlamydiaceae bacterium]
MKPINNSPSVVPKFDQESIFSDLSDESPISTISKTKAASLVVLSKKEPSDNLPLMSRCFRWIQEKASKILDLVFKFLYQEKIESFEHNKNSDSVSMSSGISRSTSVTRDITETKSFSADVAGEITSASPEEVYEAPILYDPKLPPQGIPNIGNACYRLASFQALSSSPLFSRLLSKGITRFERESVKDFADRKKVFDALCSLAVVVNKRPYNVQQIEKAEENLLSTLIETRMINDLSQATRWGQHDSAAFVEVLLNVLEETYTEVNTREALVDGKSVVSKTEQPGYPMVQIGLTRGVNNLQGLVDVEFTKQKMEETWNPPGCKATSSTECIQLSGEPKELLPIHLKRFDTSSGRVRKIDNDVNFPKDDVLDMSKAYGKETGAVKYNLKSFVYHIGGYGSGHYIAFVKRGDQWYCCNDSSVSKVSKSEVDAYKKKAYLVFFERMNLSH